MDGIGRIVDEMHFDFRREGDTLGTAGWMIGRDDHWHRIVVVDGLWYKYYILRTVLIAL